jgi:hypothetical protein
MNNTLKEYHFTDEQIVFLMQIVRDNAQYEDTEDREWMEDLANQIEEFQIVNHRKKLMNKRLMTLTTDQLSQFIDNYAEYIVERLDTKSLEMMVYDLLVREYSKYTEEEIVGEIVELYGDEVATDLLEQV